jgi:hypothetical protein
LPLLAPGLVLTTALEEVCPVLPSKLTRFADSRFEAFGLIIDR